MSMKLQTKSRPSTMQAVSAASALSNSIISNAIFDANTKNYRISYDILIQLCTVLAIIYTDEGNRCRRLGDLRTAKRHYQMAIRLHQFIQQAFDCLHNG